VGDHAGILGAVVFWGAWLLVGWVLKRVPKWLGWFGWLVENWLVWLIRAIWAGWLAWPLLGMDSITWLAGWLASVTPVRL
jgi:hypothetical protein